jgi:hypothetical protein
MHINATVFIQAVNFGITYLFLKNILLRPLVQQIKQKEAAKATFIDALKDKETQLIDLQKEITENLGSFRQNSKKFYTINAITEQEKVIAITYQKDQSSINNIAKKTKDFLLKKVPYAY